MAICTLLKAEAAQAIELLDKFDRGVLTADALEDGVLELRRKRLEQDDARVKSWPARYDVELINLLRQDRISKGEFSRRWQTLWGRSDSDSKVEAALDSLFTAIDCFVSNLTDTQDMNNELRLKRNQLAAFLSIEE